MSERCCDNRSFWDHLEEFRWRLIVMIGVWVVGVFFCFPLSHAVLRYISRPVGQLVFLSPSEAFSIRFKMALILSAMVVLPFWAYQTVQFLYEGLTKSERNIIAFGCCLMFVMASLGGIFADLILMPVAMQFLLGFSGQSLVPMITAMQYVDFYFGIILFCCLVFNIPVMMIWLAWQGMISVSWLKMYRRHIYVACFVLSAILTPPDVVTQLLMALPLCCLYEFSLIGIKVMRRLFREKRSSFF